MFLRSVPSQASPAPWHSLSWFLPVVLAFSLTMQLARSRFTIFPTMGLSSTDSVQFPFLTGFFHILILWGVQSQWQYAGQTLSPHVLLCRAFGSPACLMGLSSWTPFYLPSPRFFSLSLVFLCESLSLINRIYSFLWAIFFSVFCFFVFFCKMRIVNFFPYSQGQMSEGSLCKITLLPSSSFILYGRDGSQGLCMLGRCFITDFCHISVTTFYSSMKD